MINFGLGLTLSILAGLFMIFLFAWIAKKMKKQAIGGGILGFFVGFFLVIFLIMYPSRVYILKDGNNYSHYLVYTSTEYNMSSGERVTINPPHGNMMIINDSETIYIVEEVIYGGYGFGGDTKWIDPNKNYIIEASRIDYFFENEPPDEIRTKSDEVSKYWLRNKRD